MFKKILSGSFLVAGTTVGAGMLGIPLLTAKAGFWPAVWINLGAWLIMLWTGLLYLEATLWMPVGSNLLSMSKRFFGVKGRLFSGIMFLFLYYCLLVAYYAAGAPMLALGVGKILGIQITGISVYILFGVIFGGIVGLGAKWIDRTNIILTTGLIFSYFFLISLGGPLVETERFVRADWGLSLFAMPILFSAFGYHNIIPSLVTYFGKDRKAIQKSIFIGTLMALIIYLIWQWLVIGLIPIEDIAIALQAGKPVTAALHNLTGNIWIFWIGQLFAFFALVTSLLGVSFSMVDFFADGLKMQRHGWKRGGLSFITFFPPLILSMMYPAVFDKALGIAGGIGEAILNGLIPIGLVWVGGFAKGLKKAQFGENRLILTFGVIIIAFVMLLEIWSLIRH